MKKKIIDTCIVIALVLLMILFMVLWIKQKNEFKRQKENLKIELSKEYSRQQDITIKQLKESFQEELKVLKEYGVKPKQIENIIKVRYNYIDTLISRDTLVYIYDTIKNDMIAHFDVESGCNRIKGYVYYDTIKIESVEVLDNIMITLYKEKRKCLFKKRTVTAIAVSDCMKDTITVTRNLVIHK